MKTQKTNGVFNRSGLAALSDLHSPEHKKLFSILEKDQSVFMQKEQEWRSPEYRWPSAPLYDFSRVWEYPYAFYHFSKFIDIFENEYRPILVDIGSGVTFFPFSLAKLGYNVICTDIDPICQRDLSKAINIVPQSLGNVNFRLFKQKNILPFDDDECDGVYCISVLEHISNFEETVIEMARVLKPGGLCIITCDINLNPKDDLQLKIAEHRRLVS
ncbi:hypothetical protein C6A37_06920, partial [Desulfobacteraceae bacterium SEEP-SAG9]